MKTIKQIADEIGVSKQAVQKRMAREPLYTRLSVCIHLIGNSKHIDENGEILIKQAFAGFTEKQSTTVSIDTSIDVADNQSTTVSIDVADVVVVLQATIDTLQKQLEVKDRQIEELTATVKTQAESINADRQNVLAGTIIDGQKMIRAGNPEADAPARGFGAWIKRAFTRKG